MINLALTGCLLLIAVAEPVEHPWVSAGDHAAPADRWSLDRWSFSNGPEFPGAQGDLWLTFGETLEGELRYDFTGGGTYVAAYFDGPHWAVDGARLSILNEHGHRLYFRYIDDAGTTFQKVYEDRHEGWRPYLIAFDADAAHWGGPGDGLLRPPIRRFGFLVGNSAPVTLGAVRFRGLVAVDGLAMPPWAAATVRVGDFREHWRVNAGQGSEFSAGSWHYAMGPQERMAELRCHSHSLPGRPDTLHVTLDSDGSGLELYAICASHFQMYQRSIGVLDAPGTVTLDVPLGGMDGWTTAGGVGDGTLHPPLRLIGLQVHSATPGARGTLGLRHVDVTTRAPHRQAVAVLPQAPWDGEGQAAIGVRAVSLLPADTPATLRIDLFDTQGNVLLHKQSDVLLQPGENRLAGVSYLPGMRHYVETRATLELDDGTTYDGQTSLVRMPDPVAANRAPDSPIGMGLYLYRYPDTPQGHAEMAHAARLATRAGVVWTREEFNWSRIQPQRGAFEWGFYDRMVDTALAHGIRVYGLLCYWTHWTKPYTQEGLDDYLVFVRAVVERYGDRITHWEVWNEPNIFFWDGPKELYADLLTQAYHTIKQTDPRARVLGCSTSGIDLDFIQRVMDQGAPFDILTIHPYRQSLNVAHLAHELRQARDLVERPVWLTEMGWPTHVGGKTEREQASLVARVYLGAVASGAVENISWYDFRNDGVDPFYHEENFGLVRRDFVPKPGYSAFAAATRFLNEAWQHPTSGMPRLPRGIVAQGYRAHAERRVALWSRDEVMTLALAPTWRPERVRDFLGGPLDPVWTDGYLFLTLRPGEPVYLMGREFALMDGFLPLQWHMEPKRPRPGERVRVSFESDARLPQAVVHLPGLPPGTREMTLVAPADPAQGVVTLDVVLALDGARVNIPVQLDLSPGEVRL